MAIETGALIVGWNRAVPGREAQAAELFAQAMGYYEKIQKSGKLNGFENFFLTQHGGDFNGFTVLKGTHQNLASLQMDDEFVDIQIRAGHLLQNFGVIPAWTGKEVGEMMTRWTKHIPR